MKVAQVDITSVRLREAEVALRGNVAVVVSVLQDLQLEATVRGQRLAARMRILSMFTEDERPMGWKLTARSITPILAPSG